MIHENNIKKIRELESTIIVVSNDHVIVDGNSFGVVDIINNYSVLKSLSDVYLYDKLIGMGAAKLISEVDLKYVYAKTITTSAYKLLSQKTVVEYDKIVENILNRDRSDLCPIEKIAKNENDPDILYELLLCFYKEMGAIK